MKKDSPIKIRLKMNILYNFFGIACFSLSIIFFIGFYWTTVKVDVLTLLIAITSISLGLSLGVMCYLYYKNHTLEYDEKEIIVTSLLGNKTMFFWDEVLRIKLKQNSIVIITNLEKIKVHKDLVGFSDFYDRLMKLDHTIE